MPTPSLFPLFLKAEAGSVAGATVVDALLLEFDAMQFDIIFEPVSFEVEFALSFEVEFDVLAFDVEYCP
jgi:hypothetical protein